MSNNAINAEQSAAITSPILVTGDAGQVRSVGFNIVVLLRARGLAVRAMVRRDGDRVQHVPDAGSYAPVTILLDERSDGVHLSYDRMASVRIGCKDRGAACLSCLTHFKRALTLEYS